MSTNVNHLITCDLLALQGHITTCPSHVPGNLVTAVSWHVIGEHYHVSQAVMFLWALVLTLVT